MASTKQLSSSTRHVLIVNIGHYRRVVNPSAEVKDFSQACNALLKCRLPPKEDDANFTVESAENLQPTNKKQSKDTTLHPIVESHEEKPSTPPPSPLASSVVAGTPAASSPSTPPRTPSLGSSQVEDTRKSAPPGVTQEPQHESQHEPQHDRSIEGYNVKPQQEPQQEIQHEPQQEPQQEIQHEPQQEPQHDRSIEGYKVKPDRSIEGYNVEFLLGNADTPVNLCMFMEDDQLKLFRRGITRVLPFEMINKIYETKEEFNFLIEKGHPLQSKVGLNLDVCLGFGITTFEKPCVLIFEDAESLTEFLNDLKPHLFNVPSPDVTNHHRYSVSIEKDIYNAADVERSDILETGVGVRITLGTTHRVTHANVVLNYDRQEIILTRNTKRGILPTQLILTTISDEATFKTFIAAGDITDFASPDRRLGLVAQSFSHPFVIEFETRETMDLFQKHVGKMISTQEKDLGGSQSRRSSLSEPNVLKRARLAQCHIESLVDSEFFTD